MVLALDILESAFTIQLPDNPHFQLEDSRRLTGPGLLWSKSGAILDVSVTDFDKEVLVNIWNEQARLVLNAMGWDDQDIASRIFDTGVNLAISAPIDGLYSAVYAAELVLVRCVDRLLKVSPPSMDIDVANIKKLYEQERNPELLALKREADAHHVDFLVDDDDVSLGHGKGSKTWSVFHLPSPGEIVWKDLYDLPVALITGTNGKSTSVRLAAAVAKAAGLTAGLTSTDFVKVGDAILDEGDYSGPGGARMALRDKRVEVAFLEVARGGILRRGLPLRQAKAALVTNIAADHLGQYGVNDLPSLAQAKFAVARATAEDGVLVLNADDPMVVAEAQHYEREICWFSLSFDNKLIAAAIAKDGRACWLEKGTLYFSEKGAVTRLMNAAEIPITLNGKADYNILNALAVLGLARILGFGVDHIRAGFRMFGKDRNDNPGRCNEFDVKGARVFVDFAHNPHSVTAVSAALKDIAANRRFLLIGHAGDRSDEEIRELMRCAFNFVPNTVIAYETEEYLRGRAFGEVSKLIQEECLRLGMTNSQIAVAQSPLQASKDMLKEISPNDLALMLILAEREEIFELLEKATV